jgi:sterol desaturase/sphingolipid hydroxylase (fatty acid hydroxylase superfamily)
VLALRQKGRYVEEDKMIQIATIAAATIVFFVLERVLPGRELPESPGWYVRAAFLNGCQLGIVVLAAVAWGRWFQGHSLFHLSQLPALIQGAIGWFVGTFVFYWWHRIRHDSDLLWRICHQVHHSPSRIEILTAFYKHPVEIAADLVQCVRHDWRVLLSQQLAYAALVGLLLATAGTSLDPPSVRPPLFQLRRHNLLGSTIRHVSGHGRVRCAMRLPCRS